MRPQVGKRANQYKAPKEKLKTKARLFIESRLKHSLALKDDYLLMRDVATAVNMNALEQRILAREQVLKLMEKKLSREKVMEKVGEMNEQDRHRLSKFYRFMESK
jgi:hypothetical protein